MGRIFDFPYRTVAEISLQALVKNLVTLRLLSEREVIPVLKADAYGHGMLPLAKVLLGRGGCQMLAVATLEEAMELRKQFNRPFSILVLSAFLPHQVDAYVKFNLNPMIHSLAHLKSLVGVDPAPAIHLKVDTGMNRLGVKREEQSDVLSVLAQMGTKLSGLATHFAESDDTTSTFIDEQIAEFEQWHQELKSKSLLHTDARIHIANSGAVLRKKLSISNAVRPGLSLYGVYPNPLMETDPPLVPALQWKTRVMAIKTIHPGETVGYGRTYVARREQRIGILPVGYADGYPRLLSNVGEVLISGVRAGVLGRVSMDLIAIDLSDLPDVREGAVVTLLGEDATGSVSAWELARWAQTIPYEIFCHISSRVSRIYLDSDAT